MVCGRQEVKDLSNSLVSRFNTSGRTLVMTTDSELFFKSPQHFYLYIYIRLVHYHHIMVIFKVVDTALFKVNSSQRFFEFIRI